MEKYSEVTCLNGEVFRLSYNKEHKKGEIIKMSPSGFTVRVKKVHNFSYIKQIVFRLGHGFKVMDLEEVNKNELTK